MCPHLVHTIGFQDVLVDYIEHLKFRGSQRWQYQKLIGGKGERERERERASRERERERERERGKWRPPLKSTTSEIARESGSASYK